MVSSLFFVEILYAEGDSLQLLFCASLGRDLEPGSGKSAGTVEGKDTWAMTSLKPLPFLAVGWGICLVHISKPQGTWLSFLHLCHPAYRIQGVLERIAEHNVKKAVLIGGSKHICNTGQHTPAQQRRFT